MTDPEGVPSTSQPPMVPLATLVPTAGAKRTSRLALASLICGLFGFLLLPAIAGIVLGILGIGQIRRSRGRIGGTGIALAGLVISSIAAATMSIWLWGEVFQVEGFGPGPPVRMMESLKYELAAYHATYSNYPPSQMPDGYPNSEGIESGSQCLYYFLTGPEGKGWTEGHGLSPVHTWEPSSLSSEWLGDYNGKKFFVDGYDKQRKALLYYRADRSAEGGRYHEVYHMEDNFGPGDYGWKPSDEQWRKMIHDPSKPGMQPYNANSYLLLGAGRDRKFGFDGTRADDDMNFRRHKQP